LAPTRDGTTSDATVSVTGPTESDVTGEPGYETGSTSGPDRSADPDLVEKLEVEQPERYEMLCVEGEGGQARVLNVVDRHLGRNVALKEMLHDESNPAAARRFVLEARVASSLEHPNIIPVHELGRRVDGRPYYTMRLVRGETLTSKLGKCRSLADRLGLLGAFWDTCKAIAYAHSRGVIHRDLKPANVMIGEFGETVLVDWGIAKLKDAPEEGRGEGKGAEDGKGAELTDEGETVGTPSYMSPEQARIEPVDERTDVWGLGALLYKILTGEAPYAHGNKSARIAQAMFARVRPVRAVCREAPPELAAIVQKAMQRRKEERYQTAKDLADEISAYMTGGRVRAYSYTPWDMLRRFAADHKAGVVASCVALLAVVGGLIGVTVALREQTLARAREQQERLKAELHLAEAYAERADRLIADDRFASACGYAGLSLLHNPAHPKSPGFVAGFEKDFPRSHELRVRAASTGLQARQHFSMERVKELRAEEALGNLTFSADGRLVAAAAYDGTARVFNLETGEEQLRLGGDEPATYSAVFSPNGALLATAGRSGRIVLWRTADGARLADLEGHEGALRGLAFSPDGTVLASAGADRTVRVWDVAARTPRALLRGHQGENRAVVFSRDGRWLYSGGTDRAVHVWDLHGGGATRTLAAFAFAIRTLALSPDGTRLAVGCDGPTITVLDAQTGQPELTFEGQESFVRQVAWSPDGSLIAGGGIDRTVRVWNARTGEPVATLEEHTAIVSGVAFSPDGHSLASATFDGVLRLWEVRSSPLVGISTDGAPLMRGTYSPDGSRFASTGRDGGVRVWDLAERRELRALRGELNTDARLAFHPRGHLLAAAGGGVEIWRVETGKRVAYLPLETASAVAFPAVGNLVATGDDTGRLVLWDLERARVAHTLEAHQGTTFAVTFSPDGGTLGSAGKDGVVRLWDAASGTLRRELRGHSGWVTSLDFAADGRLVSAGKDGAAIVWDPASGRELVRLEHRQWALAHFVGTGEHVVTACDDQYVRFWHARTGELELLVRAAGELVDMAVAPDGKTFAMNLGRGFSLLPIDLTALEVEPKTLLQEARRRGFAEPGAVVEGTGDNL